MAIGFVLVMATPKKDQSVYTELSKIDEIQEVHPLFGDYDFIAKIKTEDINKLGEVVVEKVRKIDGVKDTKTLTGMHF